MSGPSPYRLKETGYGTHQAVLDLVERDARLLDVGAAGGYLSELAQRRRGARVTAVEPSAAACAECRRRGVPVIEGDVRALLDDGTLAAEGPFDQILLADVLEHLPDPDDALARLVGLLGPFGSVVVSLPNIAYAKARLRLLRGRWDYEETGIFDRTHLRFFTRASARRMLTGAGLRVEREIPIGPASYAIGRAGVAITRLRPELLASQIAFLARAG